MKIKITKRFLLREYRAAFKMILFSVFIVAGLFCFICPIFYCNDIKNLLLNMLFMLIICVPFCAIGIKNILRVNSRMKAIKNNEYVILEDVVIKKQMLHKGKSSDASDSYCQLDFQNYSKKTGKAVVVKRAVYNETKKGDIFYLVYVDNELFGFYPNNKFEL